MGYPLKKNFLKKILKNFDIHNLFFISNKKRLIGYTCFRMRYFMLNKKKEIYASRFYSCKQRL